MTSVCAGPTAAMVMLLAGEEAACTDPGRRLVNSLDLSRGAEAATAARARFPDAAARVRVRKAWIRAWLHSQSTTNSPAANTLIVAGAGLGALALDWCVLNPSSRAIELDYAEVDAKRSLISAVAPIDVTRRIACLHCDLRDIGATQAALATANSPEATPSLWVIEGLAYYIDQSALANLIRQATASPHSRVLLEFSGTRDDLNPRARAQTEAYHRYIASWIGQGELFTTDLPSLLHNSRTRVERLVDPAQAEIELGWTPHFTGPDDSSMRMAILAKTDE